MEYKPLTLRSSHTFDVHYCYNCNYEVVKGWGNNLYVSIGNRMYRWSITDEDSVARIWYIGEPGVPGVRANRKMFLVKTFNDHFPQITPQNIEQKLKFMLLFL